MWYFAIYFRNSVFLLKISKIVLESFGCRDKKIRTPRLILDHGAEDTDSSRRVVATRSK